MGNSDLASAKEVLRQIKSLQLGDLVRVEWFDASIGRSSSGGPIDLPVKSWGVFLGVFGEKNKQIILAQNNFRYTETIYDSDYTAIPLTWAVNVVVIEKGHLPADEAENVLNSFISGKRRAIRFRRRQWRSVNSEKLD